MSFLLTLFALSFHLLAIATAADTNAWKSRSIYFALTDRIARSSADNGGGSCNNLKDYCGGLFKGLESKLDYIQGMGFDAIWITPVVASLKSLPLPLYVIPGYLRFAQTAMPATMDTGPQIYIASIPSMAPQMT
jgi:hypothetical protein